MDSKSVDEPVKDAAATNAEVGEAKMENPPKSEKSTVSEENGNSGGITAEAENDSGKPSEEPNVPVVEKETSEKEENTSKTEDDGNRNTKNVQEQDLLPDKTADKSDEKSEEAPVEPVEKSETSKFSPVEPSDTAKETDSEDKPAKLKSPPSSATSLKASSSEEFPPLRQTESEPSEPYEICDSTPEKSPEKMTAMTPVPKARPGPSKPAVTRQLPIKSPEIETVDLDDDDDDDDEDDDDEGGAGGRHRRHPQVLASRATATRHVYDEDDFDEDDDDYDYYDDPDSDDQDINRVMQDAVDEINTLDEPGSEDENKMDVSSDEDDYSDVEDDERRARSVQMPRGSASGGKSGDSDRRKKSGYSYDDDDDDEVYARGNYVIDDGEEEDDEDVDEEENYEDEDDDDDEVEEVIELDSKNYKRKPSQASISMGQISVEDETDEDDVRETKKARKVIYKSYRNKLVASIRKRTFKLLNKRSMHVMEEGGDAIVCSDAKIVSLKSSVSAAAKSLAEEVIVGDRISSSSSGHIKSSQESETRAEKSPCVPSASGGDLPKIIHVASKHEENKENMTVRDIPNEPSRKAETDDENMKLKDEKRVDRRTRKSAKVDVMDDVMDDIDDIIEQAKCRNGSKGEFSDEFTFQMDVDQEDGSQGEDNEDDQCAEDEEVEPDTREDIEKAVDLSSTNDASKSDRENGDKQQNQANEADMVEGSDYSSEKSAKKVAIPHKNKDLSVSRKGHIEKQIAVKHEVEDDSEQEQELVKEPSISANKSSSKGEEKQSERSKEIEVKVSRKRRRSIDPDDREEDPEQLAPSKKLKRELENNYQSHDRLLKEYIETTSNNSVDDVQKHTDALVVEIQTLNEMIRAKENEWNNMIHLKKVKEEILLRLTRKKHVMDIVHTNLGEVSQYSHFDSSNLTNVRSASVGPRPPTPPPEVDIRPASVTPLHSSTLNTSKNANTSAHSISSSRQSKDHSSLFAQFNTNSSVTMVPLSTSPSLITSTNTILQSRANMKSAEVAKEKSNAVQIQRQILPKPVLSNHQQILNNLAMSAGLTAASATSSTGVTSISNAAPTSTVANATAAAIAANNILAGLSAQAAALLNGHHNHSGANHNHLQQGGGNQSNHLQVGRQGVIKDVKSIIADYRQKHPEQVPRRGRRLKNIPSIGYDGGSVTITNKGGGTTRMSELGFLMAAAEQQQQQSQQRSVAANLSKGAYPEVTLHPVMNSNNTSGSATNADMNHSPASNNANSAANQSQNNSNSTNSLLHGILTKSSTRPNATGFTSFSPTLARLLTAPERMNSQAATVTSGALANLQANTGLNLSKSNSEITITPVVASNLQQSLMAHHQQQLQEQQKQLQRLREQHFLNMDDEADDSVDRLVIDEGDDNHGATGSSSRADGHHREREPSVVITTRGGNGPEFHENEVPECQGCKKREAQFVCAGCGNQWYCSRECQVNAWDDHSEICTG
ncbi:probable serine/threonine-protein kinase kinX isoform X2 [Toxorhynchites rutilus septentrionalis]|uniref:probable serine/threonine-protein kinase kinX isoform X2 n=1 Tax=Toxorhynchites rutilus septentrionalis TaxID=329112 RepID=UPI00247A4BD9|nr:probable serine/threonine-protein kinase kinX isoform X2 [Toxorhynchites rutilus septentrionalis]